MENLVLGLYVLSLLACVVCLWLWWQLESQKDWAQAMAARQADLESRVDELEKRKR